MSLLRYEMQQRKTVANLQTTSEKGRVGQLSLAK